MKSVISNHPIRNLILSFNDPYGLKPKDPESCDSGGGDIAQALRDFVEISKQNLNNVMTAAQFEGGGAIAAERMALNRLITGPNYCTFYRGRKGHISGYSIVDGKKDSRR